MNDFDTRPGFDKRAWNGLKYWAGAAEPGLTIDSLIERCDVVTVGIHAAGIDTLSGMAVLGRDKADGTWLAVMLVRAHAGMLVPQGMTGEFVRLRDAGLLPVDGGAADDLGVFFRAVRLLIGHGLIPGDAGIVVNADIPWGEEIEGAGKQVVSATSGAFFSQAAWVAERLLYTRGLRHCGSPVMDWMVQRAGQGEPYDGWFMRKPTQFDGQPTAHAPLSALIMAVGLMQRVRPQERVLAEMAAS